MKYTQSLVNSFYASAHTGTISGANIVNRVVNKETGDTVKLYIVLNGDTIENVKFQAYGSVVLFASMSAIADIIIGKTLTEALELTDKQVIKEIKQVNRCDYNMVAFAVRATIITVSNYLKKLEKGTVVNKTGAVKVKSLTAITNLNSYKGEEAVSELEEIIPQEETPVVEEIEATEEQKPEISEDVESPVMLDAHDYEVVTEADENERHTKIESMPTKIEVRILDDNSDNAKDEPIEEKAEEKPIVVTPEAPVYGNVIKTTHTITHTVKTKQSTVTPADVDADETKNDDVIDEIDSITAKLTDAITKLNFKFDIDDKNED